MTSMTPTSYSSRAASVLAPRAGGHVTLVKLRAGGDELGGLLFHARFKRVALFEAGAGGVVADLLRDVHRAEVRAAHRAEVRELGSFLRQGLVVILARDFGVEREVELILPAELEARLRERVVSELRAGVALGEVCGVRGEAIGDDSVLHVLLVRKAEVLFGRDVAEHGRAEPADHRRADGRGDVVVAGRDVRDERAARVEGRFVAELQLAVQVLLDE